MISQLTYSSRNEDKDNFFLQITATVAYSVMIKVNMSFYFI